MLMGRDRWEKIRAKGKRSFIVKYGVLGWGVGSGTLVFLLFSSQSADHVNPIGLLALSFMAFPIGGLLWGAIMWNWMERLRP